MAGGLEGDNWGGIEDLHHKTLGAGNIRTWLVYKFRLMLMVGCYLRQKRDMYNISKIYGWLKVLMMVGW